MHLQITDQNAWHGAPRFIVTGEWAACHPAISEGVPTSSGIPLKFGGCGCGLGWLGDAALTLTPDAAMQAAIAQYTGANLNPKDFQNSSWLSRAAGEVAAGAFDLSWYPGTQCAGNTAPNMNLLTTGGGIVLSAGGATTGIMVATHVISAVTGAIVGAALIGAGALITIISTIFAHHAAAVRRDVNFACGAMPAVNNAFQVISQAVKAGQTTPADAANALDTIYGQFMQAGGASGPSGIPDSGTAINKHPYCNANCEMSVILKAMVIYWQAKYQAMVSQQNAAQAAAPSAAVAQQVQQLQQQAAAAQAKGDTATANALTTQANAIQQQAAQAVATGGGQLSGLFVIAGLIGAFLFLR